MQTIFLTSTGLSEKKVADKIMEFLSPADNKTVVIVVTAAEEKEQGEYCQLALKQFKELGFKQVDFFDFDIDDMSKLKDYDVLYVAGGNTFYLLHQLKKTGGDKLLKDLITMGKILYIGVSAGSIILSPTIRLAGVVDPDPNEIGLKDFSGLNLVPFEVFPHYEEKLHEKELLEYEKKYHVKVPRMRNDEALMVRESGEVERI